MIPVCFVASYIRYIAVGNEPNEVVLDSPHGFYQNKQEL